MESGIPSLIRFARNLTPFIPGIKRMAYGLRDDAYFCLKIRAACPGVLG
jgi:hypothetical protein